LILKLEFKMDNGIYGKRKSQQFKLILKKLLMPMLLFQP